MASAQYKCNLARYRRCCEGGHEEGVASSRCCCCHWGLYSRVATKETCDGGIDLPRFNATEPITLVQGIVSVNPVD